MSTRQKAVIRCAIYTRKSSEEGLEQSFNSLDAQREACAAFIASQRHEGWRVISMLYDDGGYSGGNMERPAQRQLLEDVAADKVDTIVVYKVDRLTRSLVDFANQSGASGRTSSQHLEAASDDLIHLSVEARLKRCGKEMRLVVSPDSSKPEIITPILKAIVRTHKWREGVLAGDSANRKLAAKRLNLKEEYFRPIFGCAFLAPDILEAILDGRHPSDLTVRKLALRHLPLDWTEQRTQLGFPTRQLRAIV